VIDGGAEELRGGAIWSGFSALTPRIEPMPPGVLNGRDDWGRGHRDSAEEGAMERRPVARIAGLVVKAMGDEVLVYDLERDRAHSLNRAAAAVWRACDGTRAEDEIVARLRETEVLPVTREVVRYGLDQLSRARLVSGFGREAGLTRRELMRRLGAVAVAIPLVMSIVAPTAVQAQSCFPNGVGPCVDTVQCCPGLDCLFGGAVCCKGLGRPCTSTAECCSTEGFTCQSGSCQ
jgi:Coenzyme PQQ synthesis protein D (PqqD)